MTSAKPCERASAAVKQDILADHIAGKLTTQERSHRAEFLRGAKTPGGIGGIGLRSDVFDREPPGAGYFAQKRDTAVGLVPAGQQIVDDDAILRHLPRRARDEAG